MIQRIQSLFLLVASASFWSLFKLPFAYSETVASPFFEDNLLNVNDHSVLLALCVLGGILSLVSIFLFNKRDLQLRLGYVNIIFSLFLGLVAIWLIFSNGSKYETSFQISEQIGMYMPLLSLVMIILANHFIKKDQNLVKSMDRLR